LGSSDSFDLSIDVFMISNCRQHQMRFQGFIFPFYWRRWFVFFYLSSISK
jgi:hypothetical protein